MMALLLPLAWSAAVPVRTDVSSFKPRRVAVLVGVQDYQDPALQDLAFAHKDARDMAAALSNPDIGGFDRVFLVDNDVLTTRAALEQTLRVASADLQRDDTFLLYFSGHGTLSIDPEGSRLWFLPSDARLDAPEQTGMAVDALEKWVDSLPARRRVLIMDTCHNGRNGSKSEVTDSTANLLRGFRGDPPAPRPVQEVSESEARLYAAEYQQPAMEDPALQNGVYTHFLIESMILGARDADLNGDRLVDIAEAHQYARDHTIAYTGGLQVPRAEYKIVGREEIFLSGRPSDRATAEQALLSACDLLLNRARLLVNGTPRGELPGLYPIEPGNQMIEVQTADGRRIFRERVNFTAGSTLPVEALLQRRQPELAAMGMASWLGSEQVPSLQGGIQLQWARPLPTSLAFRPDLHLSFSLGDGVVADTETPIHGGIFSAGITTAYAREGAWIGPSVDLKVPWRQNPATSERQAQLGASAGLSTGFAVPVTRTLLVETRADGWVGAWPYGEEWSPTWGVNLGLGVGFQRHR